MNIKDLKRTPNEASFSQSTPDLDVDVRFIAGHDLRIAVELHNKLPQRRDISLWFDFDWPTAGLPRVSARSFSPSPSR